MDQHMMEHLAWARRVFQPSNVQVLSLSCDATRISGKDTLAVVLYALQVSLACWAPPQVSGLVQKRKVRNAF